MSGLLFPLNRTNLLLALFGGGISMLLGFVAWIAKDVSIGAWFVGVLFGYPLCYAGLQWLDRRFYRT